MSLSENGQLMRRATYLSVAVAATLLLAKLAAWVTTDSLSLLSSLIDTSLDLLASIVNLLAVRHALQPADRQHRFGHGKAEPLAGLAQSAFIVFSSVFLAIEAIKGLVAPVPVVNAVVGFLVMAFSIVMTLGLILFQRHVVRKTSSLAIKADRLHYSGDLAMNIGIIVSLGLSSELGFSLADPLFALGVALFLVYSAVGIAWQSFHLLMDREFPDEDRARIIALCRAHPDVRDVHDVRTRSAGQQSFIQLHLELDPDISLRHAHEISDQVELAIQDAFPAAEILIHQDPSDAVETRTRFPGEA